MVSLHRALAASVGLLMAVAVVIATAFMAGLLGVPSATVEDPGDWGAVSEERTEVVTTLRVSNPNPFGITLGPGLSAEYHVRLNGVDVATGEKTRVSLQPGSNTVRLTTTLRNDRLVPWWVAYVRNDETVTVRVDGNVTVDVGPSVQVPFPDRRRTMLENESPIVDSLNRTARAVEGVYTWHSPGGTDDAETVAYEIQNAQVTWGRVTEERTTARLHYTVRNAGDVPLPAAPEDVNLRIEMNDVSMVTTGDAGPTVRRGDGDKLRPGENRTVVLSVVLDNSKIDEWFVRHVRRGERTDVSIGLQLVYGLPGSNTTVHIPRNPATHDCEFRTAIFIDGQESGATCDQVAVPHVSVVDNGQWGDVSRRRTEVLTTIRVTNPNQFSATVSDRLRARFTLSLNDVPVAAGDKRGLTLSRGTDTMTLSTQIRNDQLGRWWAAYVRDNETVTVRFDGNVTAANGGSVVVPFPSIQYRVQESDTPVGDALDGAAQAMEGKYMRDVTLDRFGVNEEITVGYAVTDAEATWGQVTDNETTVVLRYTLRNTGDVPLPAAPEDVTASVALNDVEFVHPENGVRIREGDGGHIDSGESRTIVLAITLDNSAAGDWFPTHVRNGEGSTVNVSLQVRYDVPGTNMTLRIPPQGATYDCEFRTDVLVDGQESGTTCGGSRPHGTPVS